MFPTHARAKTALPVFPKMAHCFCLSPSYLSRSSLVLVFVFSPHLSFRGSPVFQGDRRIPSSNTPQYLPPLVPGFFFYFFFSCFLSFRASGCCLPRRGILTTHFCLQIKCRNNHRSRALQYQHRIRKAVRYFIGRDSTLRYSYQLGAVFPHSFSPVA